MWWFNRADSPFIFMTSICQGTLCNQQTPSQLNTDSKCFNTPTWQPWQSLGTEVSLRPIHVTDTLVKYVAVLLAFSFYSTYSVYSQTFIILLAEVPGVARVNNPPPSPYPLPPLLPVHPPRLPLQMWWTDRQTFLFYIYRRVGLSSSFVIYFNTTWSQCHSWHVWLYSFSMLANHPVKKKHLAASTMAVNLVTTDSHSDHSGRLRKREREKTPHVAF